MFDGRVLMKLRVIYILAEALLHAHTNRCVTALRCNVFCRVTRICSFNSKHCKARQEAVDLTRHDDAFVGFAPHHAAVTHLVRFKRIRGIVARSALRCSVKSPRHLHHAGEILSVVRCVCVDSSGRRRNSGLFFDINSYVIYASLGWPTSQLTLNLPPSKNSNPSMEDLGIEVVFTRKIPRMSGCVNAGYVHGLVGLLMGISGTSFTYHWTEDLTSKK